MADLLTHLLVGYSIGTLLSLRYERLRPAHVSLVMVGAASPDLNRIELVASDGFVAGVFGLPFSWEPLHTLVGSALVTGLLVLLVAPDHRKRVLALVAVGVVSHHLLDILLITPTGQSYAVFWPILEYRIPSGDLYQSTDRWPVLASGSCATLLWAVRRRRDSAASESETPPD
ncbi:metal-dependent hydrolase [Natronosalvus caseinilyticus]|uniref:metal-dependent hydrolase n=1 Tax=Natronosalvus caseinilyticus TaxID=2953747 RepID=UPI0028A5C17E|nr:metal-dependent hydrolase [Natronosalvus caseinilyticus]